MEPLVPLKSKVFKKFRLCQRVSLQPGLGLGGIEGTVFEERLNQSWCILPYLEGFVHLFLLILHFLFRFPLNPRESKKVARYECEASLHTPERYQKQQEDEWGSLEIYLYQYSRRDSNPYVTNYRFYSL